MRRAHPRNGRVWPTASSTARTPAPEHAPAGEPARPARQRPQCQGQHRSAGVHVATRQVSVGPQHARRQPGEVRTEDGGERQRPEIVLADDARARERRHPTADAGRVHLHPDQDRRHDGQPDDHEHRQQARQRHRPSHRPRAVRAAGGVAPVLVVAVRPPRSVDRKQPAAECPQRQETRRC